MFGLFRKNKKKKVEEEVKKDVVETMVEDQPVEVEEQKEPEQVVASPEKTVETSEVVQVEEKELKPVRKMPYHITKHSDGGWQIKRGRAKKALKRFDTQKEAIEYAKVLEKEKGESYIIHKANGTTRKKTYK